MASEKSKVTAAVSPMIIANGREIGVAMGRDKSPLQAGEITCRPHPPKTLAAPWDPIMPFVSANGIVSPLAEEIDPELAIAITANNTKWIPVDRAKLRVRLIGSSGLRFRSLGWSRFHGGNDMRIPITWVLDDLPTANR